MESEGNPEDVKETLEEEVVQENINEEKSDEQEEKSSLEQELEDVTDRYKRVLAEFENFKKRSQKERETLYNSVLSDVIEAFLPVMDNLENAIKIETEDEGYKQGIELVLKQLKEALKAKGVVEIETVGQTFDPELHEAVSSIQDETKGEKEIVQEYRKGYRIGTKVIRHSMVVVAN